MLHSLDPTTMEIKLVNQKPALAQFLCLKNIRYRCRTISLADPYHLIPVQIQDLKKKIRIRVPSKL